ncbi:polymerase delta-interacting [Brachionus plicatilis]|uniref:Polymerase delta-interacting n=1 Tax=Brachionus plicatilis TaxID=10195 RepID=A0A3M7PVP2_BRAPC|nr:polymerase delta-interacting [Brachionus plicatilis]
MGKKQNDLIQSGRLSFGKTDQFDARLKLNRKQNDARQFLNKKQKNEIFREVVTKNPKSNDQIVIVTGLGNVRKDSSGIRVIKPPNHRVITKGLNTLITVNNTDIKQDDEEDLNINTSSLQPIKIQIDNDLVRRRKESPQKEILIRKGTHSYEDESMDYEPEERSIKSRLSSSIGYEGTGFKLYVSNLHPKVTEDDILELFGDIGPIKRARFIERGQAEVVYLKLEHAKEAIRKYDRNELDGRPMRIEFAEGFGKHGIKDDLRKTESESHVWKDPVSRWKSPEFKNSLSNRFKSVNPHKSDETSRYNSSDNRRSSDTKMNDAKSSKLSVDSSIIHQVLFNKKSNSNPVTFTVKL